MRRWPVTTSEQRPTDRPPTEPQRNRFLGRVRLAAVYVLVLALVLVSRPSPWLVAAGAIFVVAGEAVRAWAAGHLLKSRELVTSGPYRYTQHPLYLGRLLILTGFCLMARLPWLLNLAVLAAGCAIFFLYYLPRKMRVEGGRLREVHGAAYEQYARSVPVLFPRLTPHGENLRSWEIERFRRNREHWMIAGVAAATLVFLIRSLMLR